MGIFGQHSYNVFQELLKLSALRIAPLRSLNSALINSESVLSIVLHTFAQAAVYYV